MAIKKSQLDGQGAETLRQLTIEKKALEYLLLESKLEKIDLIINAYVSKIPIYPNKAKTIMVSIFSGLIIGFWYSVIIYSIKNKKLIKI
jgi:hypothetical protein